MSLIKEEEIEEKIKNITLKHPRNPFTHFVISEIELYKSNNKETKINMLQFNKICSDKWKKMNASEKEKYKKLYNAEKEKYKSDIEYVRENLFNGCKDPNDCLHSGYHNFLYNELSKGFEKGLDPKDVRENVRNDWAKMALRKKKSYLNEKMKNNNWLIQAEKIHNLNSIKLFIKFLFKEAKKKQKKPPNLEDILPEWEKLSNKKKISFEKYADAINSEKEKVLNIYCITKGIKPKKPTGAFRIFLQEKAKKKELKNIKDGLDMWKELKEEQKEEYLFKFHKVLLAYKYKQMLYKKQIRKQLPKKPRGAFNIFLASKKHIKPPNGEKLLSYLKDKYDNLAQEEKNKYNKRALASKERYDAEMEKFQYKIFDIPKKPISAFNLYLGDNIRRLKKSNPEASPKKLINMIYKEWKKNSPAQKEYQEKSNKDFKRFKKQIKQFNVHGYYTKDGEEFDGGNERNIQKKRRSK